MALESHRAEAVVVGEDLGTIDEAFRDALASHNVLSYRLLWFEKDDPSQWPAMAMAAVTTHDLPTVTGLWDGSDLETQRRLGLDPNVDSLTEIADRLATTAGLPPDAQPVEAVTAAYRQLSRAPRSCLPPRSMTWWQRPNGRICRELVNSGRTGRSLSPLPWSRLPPRRRSGWWLGFCPRLSKGGVPAVACRKATPRRTGRRTDHGKLPL